MRACSMDLRVRLVGIEPLAGHLGRKPSLAPGVDAEQ
jgi:hypothetical protein